MIVVVDSPAFVVLVAIGHVAVLPPLFGRVFVPPEVAGELSSSKRPETIREFIAAPPSWLEIRPPAAVEPIAGLHAGEVAASALASELKADRLIIGEARGRQAAVAKCLRVVGTVGVLELAAEAGLIDLEQAFETMKRTDCWVSDRFLDERLALFRARAAAAVRRSVTPARGANAPYPPGGVSAAQRIRQLAYLTGGTPIAGFPTPEPESRADVIEETSHGQSQKEGIRQRNAACSDPPPGYGVRDREAGRRVG